MKIFIVEIGKEKKFREIEASDWTIKVGNTIELKTDAKPLVIADATNFVKFKFKVNNAEKDASELIETLISYRNSISEMFIVKDRSLSITTTEIGDN